MTQLAVRRSRERRLPDDAPVAASSVIPANVLNDFSDPHGDADDFFIRWPDVTVEYGQPTLYYSILVTIDSVQEIHVRKRPLLISLN